MSKRDVLLAMVPGDGSAVLREQLAAEAWRTHKLASWFCEALLAGMICGGELVIEHRAAGVFVRRRGANDVVDELRPRRPERNKRDKAT